MTDLAAPTGRAALHAPPDREQFSPAELLEFVPFKVAPTADRRRRWWERRPSAAEVADATYRSDIRAARWDVSQRVVIANPKSSAKTPTGVLLGGALAENRGGDVALWDASEGAGSLRSRTTGTQQACVSDLAENPLGYQTRAAVAAAMALQDSNLHVLGSLAERNLTPEDVDRVTGVLDPYYSVQIADTGANAVHSTTFQEVLDIGDALVVPTVLTADSLNKAAEFIFTLRQNKLHPRLTSRLMVVISHYGNQVTPMQARETLVRAGAMHSRIKDVPFDTHIAEGGPIVPARLTPQSRLSWTAAGHTLVNILGKDTP